MSAVLPLGTATNGLLVILVEPGVDLTPEGIQRIESALAEGIGIELHAESDDAIRTFLQQAALLTTPPAGNGAMQ